MKGEEGGVGGGLGASTGPRHALVRLRTMSKLARNGAMLSPEYATTLPCRSGTEPGTLASAWG